MTIATCYLSPEGVVFGADSTTTFMLPSSLGGALHFNYCQKVFEVGENSTLGILTWGLGGLPPVSYRTLIAQLGDDLQSNPPATVLDVAERWVRLYFKEYQGKFSDEITKCNRLMSKQPYDPSASGSVPDGRTFQEEVFFRQVCQNLTVGFCIGGYVLGDRTPYAYEIIFDPSNGMPSPTELSHGQKFWGMPSLINRLITGCADEVRVEIENSPHWNGTPKDLDTLLQKAQLSHPNTMPIREAIDFSHTCLFTTIKAMKFSSLPQFCGGPIELAVVTTDRNFRWVRHKRWDSALNEGTLDGSSLYVG